jgi:hypothetical protein
LTHLGLWWEDLFMNDRKKERPSATGCRKPYLAPAIVEEETLERRVLLTCFFDVSQQHTVCKNGLTS